MISRLREWLSQLLPGRRRASAKDRRRRASTSRRPRAQERRVPGTGSILGDIREGRFDQNQGLGIDPRTFLVWTAAIGAVGLVLAGVAVLVLQARSDGPLSAEVLSITPTPYPDNLIVCEIDPIELEEGTNTIVNFSAQELNGFEVTQLELAPTSRGAPVDALSASIEGTLSVLLAAATSDELEDEAASYELRAVFNQNDAEIVSLCNVRVSPVVAMVEAEEGPTAAPGVVVTPRPTAAPRILEAELSTPPTPTPAPTSTPGPGPGPTFRPFPPLPTLTATPTQDPDFYDR